MLPVERPLLSKQLELLDDVLAQGIAPHKVSPPSSSFTSIRGRSRSERGVSLWIRSRGSLGGRGGSGSRDGVPADASLLETPSTRRSTQISISPVDVPAGLARGRRSRRDAVEKEEEEVQEEAPQLEEQQHRPVRPAASFRAFACLREKRPRRRRRAGTSRRRRLGAPVDVRAGTSTRA